MNILRQKFEKLFASMSDYHLHQTTQIWSSLPPDGLEHVLHAMHPYVFLWEIFWGIALVYLLMRGQGNALQVFLTCASIFCGFSNSHQ